MNREEFKELISQHVSAKYGSIALASDAWGLSQQYVGRMINGINPPSAVVLTSMGYIKKIGETTYVKGVKK